MITKIKRIVKKFDTKTNNNYYVVYFDYFNKERFTYLSKKSLEYWKNKGLEKLSVGLKINVFNVPNTNNFQIVKFN